MNKFFIPAVLSSLLSPSVFAAELAPMAVTATRTAQTVDETLASVTVISRDDIERKQANSVQDALRGVPGLGIVNNGGAGKATSVFLRGTESDHVLVLIDGVKVGSATLGRTAFQDLPIEQIERIEVVRGPLSSLYGSEAIGGVIQIFTRKGGGDLKPFFSAGVGRYDTYNASAGVSGGGDQGWYSLSVSGIDTDGFNACNGKPSPGAAGCFTTELDKDGYRNLSGNLRAGYKFNNGLEIDGHALRSRSDNAFDGSFTNESDSIQQILGGSIRFSPLDLWRVALTVGQSRDESDNFSNSTFSSQFNTKRHTVALQNDFFIAENHLFTLGADYQDDEIDGSTNYLVTSRDNTGIFAQYQGAFSANDIQLTLRHDDNEQFGNQTTGGIAWGYTFSKKLRATASYATAFKAPTFNELYFPGFGNANLMPEDSRSFEIGFDGKMGWGNWAINAYETRVDDLIAFDASTFAPANINEARIHGLEILFSTQLKGWDINTNVTLLDPENRSNDDNRGNILPRRARQSFHFDADRQFGPYSLGTTFFAEGGRYDNLSNSRKLSGYATVDLRAEYTINNDWRLQGRVENLFDKDYETAAFFNQPGRGLYVTLRYQP